MTGWEGFGLGMAGGLTGECHAIYRYRKYPATERPAWLISGFYWLATLPLVVAGGGVVWLYLASGVDISPIVALHLGLATPSLIDALSTASAPARTGKKAWT